MKFNELSKEAKENVIESWRYEDSGFWDCYEREAMESLGYFETLFDISVDDYSFDWDTFYHVVFENEDDEKWNYRGSRLQMLLLSQEFLEVLLTDKNKWTCCPWTGVFYDDELLRPLREFVVCPCDKTLSVLIEECLDNWINSLAAEYKYWTSEEGIIAEIEANDYDFDEEGELI